MYRKISYFYTSIDDTVGEGFRLLSRLAARDVDLTAVTAVPFGPCKTQLTLFPTDAARLVAAAKRERLTLDGPHPAILVHGDDQVGAFAEVLAKLAAGKVNVFSAHAMTDRQGGFSYIIYLKPSDITKALESLREP